MISWIKKKLGLIKPEPVKKKVEIIFEEDPDRVKLLEPIYKPKYLCTMKDCKCDNRCKEIIGWQEK